jgi:hypothetical protein
MEYKEAVEILISMVEKRSLSAKEKQAVLTAIGVLGWAALSKSRIKSLKAKREKNAEWK